jgi:hypothetical protein
MLTISNALSIVLRALRRSFAMSLLLCICVGVSAAQSSVAEVSLLHKETPEFTRTDLDNRKLDLRAYRGKVVLLDFWATWWLLASLKCLILLPGKLSMAHGDCRSLASPWTTTRRWHENFTRK